jgi:predicted dehydrogenase
VGLGWAGTQHALSYSASDDAVLAALADPAPNRLSAAADELGPEQTFESWQTMIADGDLDIVSVAVPNASHHEIAIAALEAGKHVISEKPISLNAQLAQKMVDAARANDRVLEVSYNHRRRADVQWIARYLAENPIGTVYHATASWTRRNGIPGLGSWFTSKALAGGGPLIDLGSHVLDIVLNLLGEPKVTRVSGVAYGELGRQGIGGAAAVNPGSTGSDNPYEVEDFASALLRLDNGGSVRLEASWAEFSKTKEDIEVELKGSTGGIRLFVRDYATSGTIQVFRIEAGRPVELVPDVQVPHGHHASVIAEFLKTIRSGAYANSYGEFALHRTRVIDAVYESAAAGREVEVEQ